MSVMLSEGGCPSRNTPTRVAVASRINGFLPRTGIEKPGGNSFQQKCGSQQKRGLSTRAFALARDDSLLTKDYHNDGIGCSTLQNDRHGETRLANCERAITGFVPSVPLCLGGEIRSYARLPGLPAPTGSSQGRLGREVSGLSRPSTRS